MALNVPLNLSHETPLGWMVTHGATPRCCWCCELCRRTLQRADSMFRRGMWLDHKSLHVLVVCGHVYKCVRRMWSARPADRRLLAATHQVVRTPSSRRLAEWMPEQEDIGHSCELHHWFRTLSSAQSRSLCEWQSDRDGNNKEQGLYCLMKSNEVSRHHTEYGSGFTAINNKRPLARWCVARWSGTWLPVAAINCRTC